MQGFYTFVVFPLLYSAFKLLSFWNTKIKQGFELRKKKAWIKPFDMGTKWIWFHVASGELEYAKPVIGELKKRAPQYKILVTFFSPSVLGALAKAKDIDLYVPMPWDTPWHWREFLNHYKPECLAIARTDTWPNMVWETRKKKTPSILFSATLPQQSGRYASFFGRIFYGSVIHSLSHISCVTRDDEANFKRLEEDVPTSVDGDTRFDQVISRIAERRRLKNFVDHMAPCFVAGSTWSEDEAILVPALREPVDQGLKVIIAPHEPTADHLDELETRLQEFGISFCRYSQIADDASTAPQAVIIIDRVGILADLYRVAQIAFVGGSFKKSVHSVMEPAAVGCLTLVGPYHYNNREALALKERGMVIDLSKNAPSRQASVQNLVSILNLELKLSDEEITKRRQGIINFVGANKGVSLKIVEWIERQIAR
jgi:3-deoxy-D-manno-octulosonic-acid transferase